VDAVKFIPSGRLDLSSFAGEEGAAPGSVDLTV
jgi:hypothetical protein